jgi:exopolyphosphatase/pppGpp-phosphohydrolase
VLPPVTLEVRAEVLTLNFAGDWLEQHPLTAYSLEQEVAEWEKVGMTLRVLAGAELVA